MMAACPAEPPIGGAAPCSAAADRQTVDLEEFLARLPRKTVAEAYEELHAARRAAANAPPPPQTIIPAPTYPPLWPHEGAGLVLYPCALECGWVHGEDTYTWSLGPIVFRPDDPGSLDRALTAQAEARGVELRERVETAVREHFAAAHPGVEIPTRGES